MQYRLARLIAAIHTFKLNDRRRRNFYRVWKIDRCHMLFAQGRDGLHFFKRLQARLRLFCLTGLGAKTVYKSLHMGHTGLLFYARLGLKYLLLSSLALEIIIAATIKSELHIFQMNNRIHRIIKQVSIMANDQHSAGIARNKCLQP